MYCTAAPNNTSNGRRSTASGSVKDSRQDTITTPPPYTISGSNQSCSSRCPIVTSPHQSHSFGSAQQHSGGKTPPPPPPSHHTHQYARHFPSLPVSNSQQSSQLLEERQTPDTNPNLKKNLIRDHHIKNYDNKQVLSQDISSNWKSDEIPTSSTTGINGIIENMACPSGNHPDNQSQTIDIKHWSCSGSYYYSVPSGSTRYDSDHSHPMKTPFQQQSSPTLDWCPSGSQMNSQSQQQQQQQQQQTYSSMGYDSAPDLIKSKQSNNGQTFAEVNSPPNLVADPRNYIPRATCPDSAHSQRGTIAHQQQTNQINDTATATASATATATAASTIYHHTVPDTILPVGYPPHSCVSTTTDIMDKDKPGYPYSYYRASLSSGTDKPDDICEDMSVLDNISTPFDHSIPVEQTEPSHSNNDTSSFYLKSPQMDDHKDTSSQSSTPTVDGIVPIKVRAVISGWKAGTIIGRQGVVISNLRLESNCKITISDDPTSPDRVLTITGPWTNVAEVLRKVCFILGTSSFYSNNQRDINRLSTTEEDQSSLSSPSMITTSRRHTRSENDIVSKNNDDIINKNELLPSVNFTLAVPSPLCGCLIGKGGSQIRDFRQHFGVSFSVSSTPIPESLDRLVNISGPPSNTANCLEEVSRLFATSSAYVAPSSSSTVSQHRRRHFPPPPPNSNDYVEGTLDDNDSTASSPQPCGAFRSNWRRNVSGANVHMHGASSSSIETSSFTTEEHQNVTETTIHYSNDHHTNNHLRQKQRMSHPHQTTRRMVQSSASGNGLQQQSSQRLQTRTHRNQQTQQSIDSSHTSEILGSAIEECSFTLSTGEIEVHLLVPNDIVGCIIGKGGKTISEIRETSGAFISITESSFPPIAPRNVASTDSYPTRSIIQRSNNSRGTRQRDRVICIRGATKNVRTARYLMGSSILNAQKTNGQHHSHMTTTSCPLSSNTSSTSIPRS